MSSFQDSDSKSSSHCRPSPNISLLDASSIMIGVIIGVGVFESSPLIASSLPNGQSVLAIWVIGALLSVVGGMCFAELATTYPEEGGPYQDLTRAFGRPVGFLFGWALLLVVRPGTIVAMAFPFASYYYAIWPIGKGMVSPENAKLALALVAIVLLSIVNIVGLKASTRTQNVLTLIKLLGIGSILLLPIFHSSEVSPPASDLNTINYGLALILVLFAYGGWSEVTLIAGEVKNPHKNLSRSIFLALAIVGALYTALNFVFLHVLGLNELSLSSAAAMDAVQRVAPDYAGTLVSILICLSALGAVHGTIMTGARVSYVLGEDHQSFKFVSGWSPKTGTPVPALIVQCVLTVLVALATRNFGNAVIYTTSVVWLFYLLCGIAVIILRKKDKNRNRPYRLPFYPLVPIIFCASCIYLIYSAVDYDPRGSLIALGVTMLGMVLYRW